MNRQGLITTQDGKLAGSHCTFLHNASSLETNLDTKGINYGRSGFVSFEFDLSLLNFEFEFRSMASSRTPPFVPANYHAILRVFTYRVSVSRG